MSDTFYKFGDVKVLVIEDNQPMLDLVKSLLNSFGVKKIYGASDGQSGFQKFCTINPDLVIVDWMMSPVDGISFLEMVRSDERSPNHFAPVILMTGFSHKHRVIQARDAGVTELLVKPFTARDLYRRIVEVIENPRQFVKAHPFFGPDRRRRKSSDYNGPERRYGDDDTYKIDVP